MEAMSKIGSNEQKLEREIVRGVVKAIYHIKCSTWKRCFVEFKIVCISFVWCVTFEKKKKQFVCLS